MLVYIKPLSLFPKLHSDTLFGAILSAISELYPSIIEEMLNEFQLNNPPFIISSTFPFIFNEDKKIRFFPKIILDSDLGSIENKTLLKSYKKAEYFEENIFSDLINGKISEVNIINNLEDNFYLKGNLLLSEDYDIDIKMSSSILPNNSINRLTNETEGIFYSEGDEYKNMGLFFFVEIFDDEYEKIIKASLKFLKDRGFGKDISTGKGQFDFEIEEVNISDLNDGDIQKGDYFITLSRFIPNTDDLKGIEHASSYEIDSKRGRDKSGEIRKEVKFFKEGSTFVYNQEYPGQIVNSGKNRPAIEYGYAFPLKYSQKGD